MNIFILIVFFLFTVATLLLFTPKAERGIAIGSMLLVGLAIWFAVRMDLPTILSRIICNVVALAWDNREQIVLAFGASLVLIVPFVMIFVALCDHFDNQAVRKEYRESNGTVRVKFNQRVNTLISQGYDRKRAEASAMRVLKHNSFGKT